MWVLFARHFVEACEIEAMATSGRGHSKQEGKEKRRSVGEKAIVGKQLVGQGERIARTDNTEKRKGTRTRRLDIEG